MSAKQDTSNAMMMCCASCGAAEGDDVKLKECDGCDLVTYCSDACKEDHRPEHEAKCKERAAKKLRHEILFRQPESTHLGDCPICCVPLPMDYDKSILYSCCSKYICSGCTHANRRRQHRENMQFTCPLCRQPAPATDEEFDKNLMKRVAANDPVALIKFGQKARDKGDYDGAIKYFTKAAELGDVEAYNELYMMYRDHVENETKEIYYLEEAAIRGHPYARHNLGNYAWKNDRWGRAIKHWIIGAKLGFDKSLEWVEDAHEDGLIGDETYAEVLRAYQAAVDATKSQQRDEAEAQKL